MYIRSIAEQAELILAHIHSGRKDGYFIATHGRLIVDLAASLTRIELAHPSPAIPANVQQ
jgi:hypothetical protein